MDNYVFVPLKLLYIKPSNKGRDCPDPLPRSGHRMIFHDNCLYVFGGYNPDLNIDYEDEAWEKNNPLFQELWKFNTILNSWNRYPTHEAMPVELASHAMFNHGPLMVVYGGTATPFGGSSSNSVHICHLPSGTWKKLDTKGNAPVPMYGQAVCRKEMNLYVVGGTTGYEYSRDVHKLNLENLEWQYLVPSFNKALNQTKARYRHEIVEYNDSIFIFGGGTSSLAFTLKFLPTFDLKKQFWHITRTLPDSKTDSFPSPRKCHVLIQFKHYVFIHGGINGRTPKMDFWRCDLKNMTWTKLPLTTEKSMHFHSACISESGCLYMFGGIWENYTRMNKVLKMWVDIPSLLEICWEALRHYIPNIGQKSPNELLSIGVPRQLVESLSDKVPAFG